MNVVSIFPDGVPLLQKPDSPHNQDWAARLMRKTAFHAAVSHNLDLTGLIRHSLFLLLLTTGRNGSSR
jgi:hypothetical protein